MRNTMASLGKEHFNIADQGAICKIFCSRGQTRTIKMPKASMDMVWERIFPPS